MIVHWRRHISKIFRRWQKVVYLVRIVEFGLCRRLLITAAPAPTSTKVMVRTDIVLLLMLAMMISGARDWSMVNHVLLLLWMLLLL